MQLRFLERGQGLAIDFLFAILVFLLLLNSSMLLIESSAKVASDESIFNALNNSVSQSADMLVRSPGEPNGWHKGNIDSVTTIGLAKRDRVLNDEKLSKLLEWSQTYEDSDYNKVKGLLLIGYDYYLKISDSGGTLVHETGIPSDNKWDEMNAINAKRIVGLNEEEVVLEFTIYYPRN